jgi:hypothetical protein
MIMTTKATELAEAHWSYVEETLKVHGIVDVQVKIIKHHYVSAMIHGYKHGREDAEAKPVVGQTIPKDFGELFRT